MGSQMLTSPGAVWAKALVVTDVVGDGSGYWRLLGASGARWVGMREWGVPLQIRA